MKQCPGIVLALSVLGIAACSTTEEYTATVECSHADMSVAHVVLPQPLDMCALDDVLNVGTHWELSHGDWECVAAREQEIDRFLRQLRDAWRDVVDEIDAHNARFAQRDEPRDDDAGTQVESDRPWWRVW